MKKQKTLFSIFMLGCILSISGYSVGNYGGNFTPPSKRAASAKPAPGIAQKSSPSPKTPVQASRMNEKKDTSEPSDDEVAPLSQ